MVDVVFSLTDAEYDALQKLAAFHKMTVQEYIYAMKETLFQVHLPMNEEVSPFENWEGFGIFSSGKTDTGERADEILNEEWNPD